MTGIFGPSIDSADIEQAVQAHLRAWMPTEIAEMLRVKDAELERWPNGVLPIRAYRISHLATPQKWPEDQLPTVVIGSPGETDRPRIEESGQVVAKFAAIVLCIAAGYDEADAMELARVYSSAARQAMLQHPSLGNRVSCTDMGPESNAPITKGVEATRHLHGCARPFEIEVEGVLDVFEGPAEPLPDPGDAPAGWPKVKEGGTHVEVRSGKAALDELRDNGHFD